MRSARDFYRHVRRIGFRPATVIDVGVAWGTPELYKTFPDAYYYLFEALPVFEPSVRRILRRRRGEYWITALANESGERTIYVGAEPLRRAGASIYQQSETEGAAAIPIKLTRLDDAMAGKLMDAPALLKIDAQGADIEVLRGGQNTLRRCELVVAEAAFYPLDNPDNQVHKVIAFMDSIGFAVYDFFSPMLRPHDHATGQIDIAFAPEKGMLRKYKYW